MKIPYKGNDYPKAYAFYIRVTELPVDDVIIFNGIEYEIKSIRKIGNNEWSLLLS